MAKRKFRLRRWLDEAIADVALLLAMAAILSTAALFALLNLCPGAAP